MRLLPCGEHAVLLDCADLGDAQRWYATLSGHEHVVEAVLGARTVLLRGDPPRLRSLVASAEPASTVEEATAGEEATIEVVYGGPDLAEVARLTGLDEADVVAAHTGAPWTVAFGGFAPGFAYLVGGDARLAVPRRGTPRSRVPAGAVGLAGEFSGVYPRGSPGGWQLIGSTDAVLFDVGRSPAALLRPGMRVRFTSIPTSPIPSSGERDDVVATRRDSPHDRHSRRGGGLVVVEPGPLTLVQDRGRPGLADQGVGASGAFDRRALGQLEAVLDNEPGAAVLEVLGGGLVLRAECEVSVAVTGGIGPVLVDGRAVEHGRAVVVPEGARLELGPLAHGLRAYVGVAGGLDVEPVLGSSSTDTLGGLGPPRLAAGDRLPVGTPGPRRHLDDVPALLTPGTTTVDVLLGPRDGWFTDAALHAFLTTAWTVSERSDRIGVRLEGPALERREMGELPSEPCVRGSVQVTSDGLPVVLGPDHPVTGGYPVAGVVRAAAVDRLAQVRPGETVRFRRRT